MKFFLFVPFYLLSTIVFSQSKIDSLCSILPQKEGKEKVDIYNKISSLHFRLSPNLSAKYADSAIFLSSNIGYRSGLADAYKLKGTGSTTLGEFDLALSYDFKSLKLYESLEDTIEISHLLNNIAYVYLSLSNYNEALEYFTKSLELIKGSKYNKTIGIRINNIGVCNEGLQNYEKALENYLQALKIFKKIDDKETISLSLNNIGGIFFVLKDYSKALEYHKEALSISILHKDKGRESKALLSIGTLYIETQQYDKAYNYIKKALEIAQAIEDKKAVSDSYYQLSQVLRKKKEYKRALEYYTLFHDTNDSIYNIEKTQQIAEIKTRFEYQKKEQENALLRKDNKIQELALKTQTNLRNFFIALSILVIMFIIFIANRLRVNNKKRLLLIEKNTIITSQQDSLTKAMIQLEESNATKNKFFSIIAHDLKSPFNSMIGLSEILKDRDTPLSKDQKQEIIESLYNVSKKSYVLLENLLNWAQSQQGKITINKEYLVIKDVVNNAIAPYMQNTITKEIKVDINIPKGSSIYGDRNTMQVIIGNLFNNATKYTYPKGTITISVKSREDNTDINISDTGIGMSHDKVNRLFKIDEGISTPGTNQEEGTGLGLVLCKEFADRNNGVITVKSKENEGSTFTISLPNPKT